MTKKPFAIWEIDGEEYKLKLKTSTKVNLEEKFKTSLLNLVANEQGLPLLSTMLTITHAAMKDWHANIKRADVDDLYDQYIDEGGSQMEFYMNVFFEIYKVSGFFSKKQLEDMESETERMEEIL